MYVGLKQPRGDGERCVTPARAAAKETMFHPKIKLYYTQTKKTVNTENISGMFIVFWPQKTNGFLSHGIELVLHLFWKTFILT